MSVSCSSSTSTIYDNSRFCSHPSSQSYLPSPVLIAPPQWPRRACPLPCGEGQVCPKFGEDGVERERRRGEKKICAVEGHTEGNADRSVQCPVEKVPRFVRQHRPGDAHCVQGPTGGRRGRAMGFPTRSTCTPLLALVQQQMSTC